jgi:hypothetical protein
MELGDDHSGYSFGITMRGVEYIIKHGFNAYIAKISK